MVGIGGVNSKSAIGLVSFEPSLWSKTPVPANKKLEAHQRLIRDDEHGVGEEVLVEDNFLIKS